jgi:hypothetical protein
LLARDASTFYCMAPTRWVRVVLAVAAGTLLVGLASSEAEGARRPTPKEWKELDRALSVVEVVPVHGRAAMISTVDPAWASIRCSSDCQDPANWLFLFRRTTSGWHRVGFFELDPRPIGFCAYASAAVIRDLFRINCPPWRALHARHASPAEKHDFAAALTRWDRAQNSPWLVMHPCVSRLYPTWAAAFVSASKHWDPYDVWFQLRGRRWTLAYGPPYGKRARPSNSTLLSLASCVGYSGSG